MGLERWVFGFYGLPCVAVALPGIIESNSLSFPATLAKQRATCAASEDGTRPGLRSSVSAISFMISDILRGCSGMADRLFSYHADTRAFMVPIGAGIRASDAARARWSFCRPATASSSGHSTAKSCTGYCSGFVLMLDACCPFPSRERVLGTNKRSPDIVGVIAYRPGRQSCRLAEGVSNSRKASSG
jgi:hypothetical protein